MSGDRIPPAGSDSGLARLPRVGQLEARVLEVLWDDRGWLSTNEVRDVLLKERQLAYTTVMTILVRLGHKGLTRRRKDGLAYVYQAVLSREEWTARRMADLLGLAENRSQALSHFVSDIDQTDLDQLRRLLRIDP